MSLWRARLVSDWQGNLRRCIAAFCGGATSLLYQEASRGACLIAKCWKTSASSILRHGHEIDNIIILMAEMRRELLHRPDFIEKCRQFWQIKARGIDVAAAYCARRPEANPSFSGAAAFWKKQQQCICGRHSADICIRHHCDHACAEALAYVRCEKSCARAHRVALAHQSCK